MSVFPTLTGARPKIIAHRGASGYLPEHTLEAYALAVDMGADFIELDLHFTSDGALIVCHDPFLSTSTNISNIPAFENRKRRSNTFRLSDWFIADFTAREIKTLKCRQAFPGRSNDYDNKFSIPTFDQALDLVVAKSKEKGRTIGVYPDTKHPRYYKRRGHDFIPPLLWALKNAGLAQAAGQVIIQSFEPMILRRLSKLTPLLLTFLLKENFKGRFLLPLIARYAAAIGPAKDLLVQGGKSTGFLEAAHRCGLQVHPYTFRDDAVGEGFENIDAELEFHYRLGVDAVFTDFTDTAVAARKNLS